SVCCNKIVCANDLLSFHLQVLLDHLLCEISLGGITCKLLSVSKLTNRKFIGLLLQSRFIIILCISIIALQLLNLIREIGNLCFVCLTTILKLSLKISNISIPCGYLIIQVFNGSVLCLQFILVLL